MLPPVLEIYGVWHPSDTRGRIIAESIVTHFHGTSFSGLIGGAIEVFIRSAGWKTASGAPRPLPCLDKELNGRLLPSEFLAVVPLLGNELASTLETGDGDWKNYLEQIFLERERDPKRLGIFPFLMDGGVLNKTQLGEIFGGIQQIATSMPDVETEEIQSLLCRDLAQGITQMLEPKQPQILKVFISHTKRAKVGDEEDTLGLVALVRAVIAKTRLKEYFDANDLQPGTNWDAALRSGAAHNALLAVRTDLYPSREWCQREVLIAKQSGMPVIFLDAPGSGEERGSFLMDHAPRIPVFKQNGKWIQADVYRALTLLVDECLKRVLWAHQQALTDRKVQLEISWWAPHAPEPITLLHWLSTKKQEAGWPPEVKTIYVLHPDPPLGPDEKDVLIEMLDMTLKGFKLDVMTPRLLAARGG